MGLMIPMTPIIPIQQTLPVGGSPIATKHFHGFAG